MYKNILSSFISTPLFHKHMQLNPICKHSGCNSVLLNVSFKIPYISN